MNLKSRFMVQNFITLGCTLLITLVFCQGYSFFQGKAIHPVGGNIEVSSEILVSRNENILYHSEKFDAIEVRNILMSVEMGQRRITLDKKDYHITDDTFSDESGQYHVIKLTPSVDIASYYSSLTAFGFVVFLLTFIISTIAVQRQRVKNIIQPLVNLRNATQALTDGDLEKGIPEEGEGEIRELCRAVELLRLRLKDSVYHSEKTDENRDFLISSISHDLKTPVTAIGGYISGILDGVANTEEKRSKYLHMALHKTTLLTSMINDLLLYSKLELNQIPFDLERVSIGDYLNYIYEENLVAFDNEHKTLRFLPETDNYTVLIDEKRFKRVVQNILDNAKKNIQPETGSVDILLRETVSSVIIEIKDNGNGIAEADLPNIFDRFYRADSARKVEGSSGLGLAIAKQIVEGLGGRIWAISTQGEGASILISLKKHDSGKDVE